MAAGRNKKSDIKKSKVKRIGAGHFCTVLDSTMAEYGVKRGDLIYVAGQADLPISEEDPYTLRRVFIVSKVSKDGHVLAATEKAFTIDPKRLRLVSKARQERFNTMMQEDFRKGDKEEVNCKEPEIKVEQKE